MPGTVGALLRDAAARLTESGSETPRLDAEVLLGHVLRVDRATLLGAPEASVGADAARTFALLVERRAKGEPVAYIRGLKEFHGLAFSVDERGLIPRPETETLVDLALTRIVTLLTETPRDAGALLQILDVGTGSGAIIVSIAVESRRRGYGADIRLRATDVSREALSLAVENAVVHGVADAIDFVAADLTSADGLELADLVLANLPYIPSSVVPTLAVATSFEPKLALDGGRDGLDLIRALIGQLPHLLRIGGVALLEIGSDQGEAVVKEADGLGDGWSSAVFDDLSGRARVVEIARAAA